jgi:hypothetical protein
MCRHVCKCKVVCYLYFSVARCKVDEISHLCPDKGIKLKA